MARHHRAAHVPDDRQINRIAIRSDPLLRAALYLMADCGCRLNEALAYSPSSLSPNVLRIYATKTRSWRSVPCTTRTRRALAIASRLLPRTAQPLATIGQRHLQRRLHELAAAAECPPTSPHRLRHSYATRLAGAGIPLHTISALLGHAKLSTTLVYLHTGESDFAAARRALEALARHPR